MKKITLVIAAMLAFVLTACSQNNKKEGEMKTKTLVAYFSCTGTTRAVAEQLAKVADADLYEITPETPYSAEDLDWTNKQSRSTKESDDPKSRPAIKKRLKDVGQYDVVYLGFPIWWYRQPNIINTFLDTYDLSGKEVHLFATSGGSTPDKAKDLLSKDYPKVKFVDAKLLNSATADELKTWVGNHK
jgi:flavodoxin